MKPTTTQSSVPIDSLVRKSAAANEKKRVWLLVLVLVSATIAVYANSFSGVFLFDDIPHIIDNEVIHRLWPPWDLLRSRRAVLNLTLAVNYAWHGLDVWGYHLINVTVHILAGLALFGLIRRTLMTPRLAQRFAHHATILGFISSLLWLAHPLCTQSVTYIVQRGEALMGLFYLLTLYALLRGDRSNKPAGWYVLCVVVCALGMASKAVMVTAPLVALLYDRTFLSDGFMASLRRRWLVYVGLVGTWGVLFGLGIVQSTFRAQPNPYSHVGFSHTGVTAWQYATTQPGVIVHYLRLALWPDGLCLDYNWPVAQSAWEIVGPSIVIGALLLAAVIGTVRRTGWGFLAASFFLVLSPTSSFIPIKDLAFEHRMYLPLAAVAIAIVLTAYRIMMSSRFDSTVGDRRMQSVGVFAAMAAAVALGVGTVHRNRAYDSEETMWRDVASKRPNNPRGYVGVGAALQRAGKIDEALTLYRRALALNPDYADAWYNVATALEAKGDVDGAANAYETVIRFAPRRTNVYESLARMLGRAGRNEASARWFQRLTAIEPESATWYYEWGNALTDADRDREAILRYREAVKLRDSYFEAWINLGNALRRTNAPHDAVEAYRHAVEQDRSSAIGWMNLANTLAGLRDFDEASDAFREVIALDPRSSGAHAGLGWCLERLGHSAEAASSFERALEIDPENQMARDGLSVIKNRPALDR